MNNFSDFYDVLAFLLEKYGYEIFDDSKRLSAFIGDLAPSLKKERKITIRLSSLGVFKRFSDYEKKTQSEQDRIFADTLLFLVEEEFFDKKVAEYYLNIYRNVFCRESQVNNPFVSTKLKEQIPAKSQIGVTKKTQSQPKIAIPLKYQRRYNYPSASDWMREQGIAQLQSSEKGKPRPNFHFSPFLFGKEIDGHVTIGYKDLLFSEPKVHSYYNVNTCDFSSESAVIRSVEFPENYICIKERMFKGCVNLVNVIMPKYLEEIKKEAFSGCSQLSNIFIPSNVSVIENNTFNECTSLKSVILPETITSIGQNAFRNCSSLRNMVLPPNIKHLGDGCFDGCSDLRALCIPASVECFNTNSTRSSGVQKLYLEDGVKEVRGELHSVNRLEIWIPNSVKVIQLSSYPQKLIIHCSNTSVATRIRAKGVEFAYL